MHLSEEEKKKQKAISDSIIKNQPVENLADGDLQEDEKIENSITMGLKIAPLFVKLEEKNEENKKNEQNEEITMGTMGSCNVPPKAESPIKKFFRKLIGK